MRIRLSQLRRVIKEEISRVINESGPSPAEVKRIVADDPELQDQLDALKDALGDQVKESRARRLRGTRRRLREGLGGNVMAAGVLLLGGIVAASGADMSTLPMAVSALGALGIGAGAAAEIFAAYQKKHGGDASWNESHPESANLPDDSHL